ncbi:MAG: hypothetical protein ACJAXI_000142 [Crocinitomicaceae bacterium]|jgi:hypothetical protein
MKLFYENAVLKYFPNQLEKKQSLILDSIRLSAGSKEK